MTIDHPNFIFITTDQQRADSLGCYGSAVAVTPNIDRLAAEGVRFEQCYTTNPVCMPARASWVTGSYPSHHGCWQNGVPLSPQSDMIQTRLGMAGYHTALIGKIHLDNVWLRNEKHPAYGFDTLIECEGDPYCKDDYFQWLDEHGLYDDYIAQFKREGHQAGYVRDLPEDKHMNNWITGHADAYLKQRTEDGRPFFLNVGFFDPHHPFDPVEPYASMFKPEAMPMPIYDEDEAATMVTPARSKRERECEFCRDPDQIKKTIAAYHATITHVDAMVGRLMQRLDDCGLADTTIVIFGSDHGELLGDHGMLHKGGFFYDCSIRVPLIYRFPAAMNVRGVERGFVSHVDLAPTIAALAGVPAPALTPGTPLFERDGTLHGSGRNAALVEWCERPLNETGPYQVARCLVTDDWKYVRHYGQDYGELYDRQRDPHELRNLCHDPGHADVVTEMRERLFQFIIDNEPRPPRTDIF